MTKGFAEKDQLDMDDSVSERIQRAEAAIAGLRSNFAVWVKADLESIGVHLVSASTAKDQKSCAEALEAARRVAHNIKGQGGTFGCFCLSEAAGELDALLKRRSDAACLREAAEIAARLSAAYQRELA